jgi:hypothetical protein
LNPRLRSAFALALIAAFGLELGEQVWRELLDTIGGDHLLDRLNISTA